jgi:hypothetical protein
MRNAAPWDCPDRPFRDDPDELFGAAGLKVAV